MNSFGRSAAAFGLAAGLLAGCSRLGLGGSKPDAERVRDALDVLAVHLYLTAKVAAAGQAESPAAKESGALLGRVIAEPGALASGDFPRAKLVSGLWSARDEGKRVLAANPGKDLPAVLPKLRAGAPADVETEHAFLLTAMFMARHTPGAPVPVPAEWVLYEAWMTKPDAAGIDGFAPALHGMRAAAFASAGLCDLGAESSKLAAETSAKPVELAGAALAKASGNKLPIGPAQAAALVHGAKSLGRASLAQCYAKRGDLESAKREASALLDEAKAAGASATSLAPLEAAKKALEAGNASRASALADDTSAAIAKRLDESGLAGELAGSSALGELKRFVTASVAMLDDAKKTVPSFDAVKKQLDEARGGAQSPAPAP